MRKAGLFSGLLSLMALTAFAGPLGAPTKVSTCATCRQELPAVAGAASGAFLVVWQGTSATDLKGINGRRFGPTGAPAAADFVVAKDVAPDQYEPSVTRDAKGNYIVVWSEVSAGNSEIKGQIYTPAGAAMGPVFKVNQDATGTQTIPADFMPSVAATKTGFVVVWLNLLPPSSTFPGTKPQVLARRFNATGVPQGAQIKLNAGLVIGSRPEVCVDTTDRIIAIWTSADQFLPFQPSKMGISMRRLSPTGTPLAAEEIVLPPTSNVLQPAIGCGAGSTFVIVWHGDLPPAVNGSDILGQRYSRLARKVGPAFRVNVGSVGEQRDPSISFDTKGNYVVAWQGYTGSKYGVFTRRYTAAGVATGGDIEVATDDHTRLDDPRVAHVGTAGNYVVVWKSPTREIFSRRFAP